MLTCMYSIIVLNQCKTTLVAKTERPQVHWVAPPLLKFWEKSSDGVEQGCLRF